MMANKGTRKQWVIVAVVLVVLVYSAARIDYSGLVYPPSSMAGDVFRGLAKPTWGCIYDGDEEDLISLLFLTPGIAYLGTAIVTIPTPPITLLSSSSPWRPYPRVAKAGKFVCNVLRAFPELVYAIISVKTAGSGPFASVLVIGVHQIGMLGKSYTGEMGAMEENPVEAMMAVGAGLRQAMFFARIPQLMPIYSSLSLSHFKIAVRSATVLGLVGVDGIGASLVFVIQVGNRDKVSVILIDVIVAVFAIDSLAGYTRKKPKQGLRQKKKRIQEMYILHLSDIHYRREFGKGLRNVNGDGYQNMLSAIQNLTVPLDEYLDRTAGGQEMVGLVVVTDDLTEDGNAEDYRSLKHHIRERIGDAPLVVILGNHDNRQNFREGWSKEGADGERIAGPCDNRPYRQVEWVGGTAVISFGTSVRGVPDGRLDEERFNWLRIALEEVGNHPTILVTYHHLLCEQGQILLLPESSRLLGLIGDSGIFLILCGHTYHHYVGSAAGRPRHIVDSLSFYGDNAGGGKVRFQEKYSYNSHRIEEGMVRMSRSETLVNGRILGTLTFQGNFRVQFF